MSPFLSNILLTLGWVALTGVFTVQNLGVGFLLGVFVLWAAQQRKGSSDYLSRLRHAGGFLVFFLWELVTANLRVTHDVLTLRHRMRPGILAIPIELASDLQILVLGSLITLTPGTLTLDVSEDRRTLFIHAMYIDDAEAVRRRIKEGYERRVLEVFP